MTLSLARRTRPWKARSGTLWGNHDFMLLWSGQSLSVLGSRASSLALPLLVLKLTHSPAQAGIVAFVANLPVVVCQLPAGALVDRWNRKTVMIGCDVGRLLVIASIPVLAELSGISYPQLVMIAFLHAALSTVFDLAERAALPHVVDAGSLPGAVAQNQARMQGAILAGPPLGGALFGISPVLPFAADVISYLISLVTLVLIRTPLQDPPRTHAKRLHHDVIEGLRFVWTDQCLRTLAMFSAAITFLVTGFPLAVIVLARHLGATPSVIGLTLGASGIGGLLGALVAPRLVRTIPAGWLNITGIWIWGALITLIALASSVIVLVPITAAISIVAPVLAVIAQTRRAHLIPRHLLGRVYSVNLVMNGSTASLGALLTGFLLSWLGGPATCALLGSSLLIIAATATSSPTMRHAIVPQGSLN